MIRVYFNDAGCIFSDEYTCSMGSDHPSDNETKVISRAMLISHKDADQPTQAMSVNMIPRAINQQPSLNQRPNFNPQPPSSFNPQPPRFQQSPSFNQQSPPSFNLAPRFHQPSPTNQSFKSEPSYQASTTAMPKNMIIPNPPQQQFNQTITVQQTAKIPAQDHAPVSMTMDTASPTQISLNIRKPPKELSETDATHMSFNASQELEKTVEQKPQENIKPQPAPPQEIPETESKASLNHLQDMTAAHLKSDALQGLLMDMVQKTNQKHHENTDIKDLQALEGHQESSIFKKFKKQLSSKKIKISLITFLSLFVFITIFALTQNKALTYQEAIKQSKIELPLLENELGQSPSLIDFHYLLANSQHIYSSFGNIDLLNRLPLPENPKQLEESMLSLQRQLIKIQNQHSFVLILEKNTKLDDFLSFNHVLEQTSFHKYYLLYQDKNQPKLIEYRMFQEDQNEQSLLIVGFFQAQINIKATQNTEILYNESISFRSKAQLSKRDLNLLRQSFEKAVKSLQNDNQARIVFKIPANWILSDIMQVLEVCLKIHPSSRIELEIL